MSATPFDVNARAGTYQVSIARGLGRHIGEELDAADLRGQRIVVTSPRVWRAQGPNLRIGPRSTVRITIPDGETAKTLDTVSRVYDALLRAKADRGAVIVAVGGGVIGDMVGFAAATFLRGVALVHVPTTLMAQVDSAIGGKVGVNHARGKNLIGAFYPPRRVLVDPDRLATLSRREFRAGMYEVIKYGAIASAPLIARLETSVHDVMDQRGDALAEVVEICCRIKGEVVSADERESGARRALNFGHTLGHALEAVSGYRRLRHGEAVGWGMKAALALGTAKGVTPPGVAARIATLIDHLGPLPPVSDLRAGDVVDAVSRDKKVVDGTLHFVAVSGEGRTTTLTDVTARDLRHALGVIGVRR